MVNDLLEKRREQMFPKLSAQQIGRLEAHGKRIEARAGEVLIEPGELHRDFLVVLKGSLEVTLPGIYGEQLLTVSPAG
jgi:CRP-like cAMP-binding protein